MVSQRTAVKELCDLIDCGYNGQLLLDIDNAKLFHVTQPTPLPKSLETAEHITLAEGLFWKAQEILNPKAKVCLALILSYSFLDFCGEQWFPMGWHSDGIYLLQDGKRLMLRPALLAHMHSSKSQPSEPAVRSQNRQLLFHAILLLEVFKQEPLNLRGYYSMDVETLRREVQAQFDIMDGLKAWSQNERYRQAVEACINGDEIEKLQEVDHHRNTEAHFLEMYFPRVIDPLQTDFSILWGVDSDPDKVVSELMARSKPPSPKPKPALMKGSMNFAKKLLPCHPSLPHPPARGIRAIRSMADSAIIDVQRVKFFDSVEKPEKQQVEGALRWFQNFDQPAIQNKLPKRAIKDKRVKIAILDTGVNLENVWISTKKGRIECWPSKRECVDTDGHGSHVTYLLLRLAEHAQLKVAKVSDSQTLGVSDLKETVKKIADVSTKVSLFADWVCRIFGISSRPVSFFCSYYCMLHKLTSHLTGH